MTRRGIFILAGIFLSALVLIGFGRRGYEEVEGVQSIEKASAKVRKDFPGVKPISPGSLRNVLEITPEIVLLIDAREPKEYALSHLPGAVNLRSQAAVLAHLRDQPVAPEIPIVYCSIGFRSAALADSLRREYPVENLDGGIFLWANEGGALITSSGESTALVHPYNRFYGRLLDLSHRASLQEPP